MREYRVLIVEDDPLFSSHLEAILEDAIPAKNAVVSTIAAAEKALQSPIDIAFLDVEVVDGRTYGLAASLAAANVPFTFLSASSHDNVPPPLRSASFIVKPYGEAEVRRFLAACGIAAGRITPHRIGGGGCELGG